MPTINQLSTADTLSAGDLLAIFSTNNGDARKASLTALLAYIQSAIDLNSFADYTPQYSAPSSSGFSVQVTNSDANTWLILTPTGTFAAGTIVLPAIANVVAGQELLVNCTQQINTLTISANGATAVTGAPTSLSANGFFRLRFDSSTNSWYRVG